MDNLGYCCINTTLKSQGITTNRSLIKRNFDITKVNNLALANVKNLLSIIKWNESMGIRCFRISSDLFPHMTNGDLSYCPADLPDGQEIVDILKEIGQFAFTNNHILGFHPGPYTCLASLRPDVVEKSIKEVLAHGWIADTICNGLSLTCNINFHIGCSYDESVANRFISSFNRLGDVGKRCVIENDDKKNGWSVLILYNQLWKEIGIPITQDLHHSKFCPSDGLSLEEEFNLAKSTWNGKPQEIHYSESADGKRPTAHSDYYLNKLPDFLKNENVYVHLECKSKELGLLDYRKKFS